MYELLLYLHNNDIYSCKWILSIQKILQDVGLKYIWITKTVPNINWLCREVKDRLEMQFVQKWNSDVLASPKCINYRIFKTEFEIEPYITELQPRSYITLSRFRTTNNRLPIEWGRWENVEVYKDSVIYVRETCWAMSSTICSSAHTSQKKERNIYQNSIYDMLIY